MINRLEGSTVMKKSKLITLCSLLLFISVIMIFVIYSDNRNTENVPEGVIQLNFEFTNVFLIPISNGYVLVDNAYEKEIELFEKLLLQNSIDISEIKYVLLTHHHDDHVGFANYLTNKNPDVKIIMHEKTVELIKTGLNNKMNGGGIVNKRIYTLFRLKQIITPDWDLSFPQYMIRENDIIIEKDNYDLSSILGINIKAMYTPGHTSDSTSFIYNDKYVFCGDLASNFLNWAGANYLTLFNEDLNQVYESWDKLIRSDVEVILTAHGKPFNIENLENNIYKNKQENITKFF